ncbi:alpha/beta hydrolase-fold protein [Bdellovibrio bacteriovorus]|uniref:alpha/beta hydrolase-fold protein n=1 Tax=Bdellovibrio bacteriovorus TaxID=959 RepID=UPI003AA937F8
MKRMTLAFLLLCVSLWAQGYDDVTDDYMLAEADVPEAEFGRGRFICDSEELQGVRFKYCYRDPDSANNNDIVYFFHGLNGSEKTWHRQFLGTRTIQDWWELRGYRPRIISVSFGPQWLLVNNKRYPLLPAFTRVIMPFVEKKVGGLKGGQRHIIGQSMGGFNAAEISLKNPGMFSKVALLCPALATISPFASDREIDAYIRRTGALRCQVEKMQRISQSVFVDKKDWDNHDPLRLISRYPKGKKPRFYVSIGRNDGYGFQEGSAAFIKGAQAFSFLFSWVPVPGPHCNFKRIGTANFIMGD